MSVRPPVIALPTGLVTFLITDIEGSTELVQSLGEDVFAELIDRHNELLHEALSKKGIVVHVTGDSFFSVFEDPLDAVTAAVEAQRRIAASKWPESAELRVRMGLHSGEGRLGGEDYIGLDVHRAARISSAGNGGQVVVSAETHRKVVDRLPPGLSMLELGPHRLKDLSRPEDLFLLLIEDLPREFIPIRGVADRPGNLRESATSFIGRSSQIAEIVHHLESNRLVTLTGPGGTGKTRLSMKVAEDVLTRFPDGVFFVDLEPITDEQLIPGEILKSMQRPSTGVDSGDQLMAWLARKTMLMILDNYEQILPAASVVASLISKCINLRLVVTSRAPLGVRGEQEYPVPPLVRPSRQNGDDALASEAVQLFVERAMAVDPAFRATEANMSHIVELVSRLDGLPLAIELAASRTKVLSPADISQRLSNHLLANLNVDAPRRQQTISNAIEWSYQLLSEPARKLFERFSVFLGDAGLDAIEQICDPNAELGENALDTLASLVDQSLVEADRTPGMTRFQMLTVVREFAFERLATSGEIEAIRDRHLEYYSGLAAQAGPLLLTGHEGKWLNNLATEHDNLRTAHDWAVEKGSADVALEMVNDLWRFWQRRGHLAEGRARVERTLALPDASPIPRARGLEALGGLCYWAGSPDAALASYEESLKLIRVHGGPIDLANALYNSASISGLRGEESTARSQLEELLVLSEAENYPLGVGRAYWGLCDVAFINKDFEASIEWALKAEMIFTELDAPFDLGWSRFMIANAAYLMGDSEMARRYIDSTLPQFVDVGDVSAFVLVLYVKAGVLESDGDPQTAARILGAIETLTERSGVGIGAIDENQDPRLTALQETSDPEIRRMIEAGRALSTEEVVELALSS